METISYYEKVNWYLEKNGITDNKNNNKELLKSLKKVIYNEKVKIDILDMDFHSNANTNTIEEYVNSIHKLNLNIEQAQGFILGVKAITREERRLKFKQKIKCLLKK